MEWIWKQPWGTRPTSAIPSESDVERIYETYSPMAEKLMADPEFKALFDGLLPDQDRKH